VTLLLRLRRLALPLAMGPAGGTVEKLGLLGFGFRLGRLLGLGGRFGLDRFRSFALGHGGTLAGARSLGQVRIAFAADDENETTLAVRKALSERGHDVSVLDAGSWPDLGAAVGRAVVAGTADLGVVMCWTGTGTAIAANKVRGVRAALAWDPWVARGARLWNDANVLAMSLKRLAPDVAVEVLLAFLDTTGPDPQEAANIARLGEL
jgi:ribose 5-phosphate isomerase B